MKTDGTWSPAARVMNEAIDLAIEGEMPYPERATFVDDGPGAAKAIERAVCNGRAVVLVSADGSTRVLPPG